MRFRFFLLVLSVTVAGCYESTLGVAPEGDGGFDTGPEVGACETPVDLMGRTGTVARGSTRDRISSHRATCGSPSAAGDVVYEWTVPSDGDWVIDTEGSMFDTVLEIRVGGCAGEVIQCDDDSGESTQSLVRGRFEAGQRLTIIVDGYFESSGEYVLNINRLGGAAEDCFNGIDDDGDRLTDCDDPDCAEVCRPEPEDCFNGRDDDRDGLTDCEDFDCAAFCREPEDCFNGRDDDGNGLVDCEDPFCADVCRPEDCFNGRDDDRDGATDCEDIDCADVCREDCGNGVDDDGDRRVDCDDPDCDGSDLCRVELDCVNGIDDDEDGPIDCEDRDCARLCSGRESCNDRRDNDGDGLVDCEDPSCNDDAFCRPMMCAGEELSSMTRRLEGTLPEGEGSRRGSCAGNGNEIEYLWVAPSTGRFRLETIRGDMPRTFDTVLYVLDGCDGPELVCDDDDGERNLSLVEFDAVEGSEYLIVLDAFFASSGGEFTLLIDPV